MSKQKRTSKKKTTNTWQRVDAAASAAVKSPSWLRLKDEQLLDVPISALGVSLEDNPNLIQMRDQLYGELDHRDLKIKPHMWPVSYTHLTLPTILLV